MHHLAELLARDALFLLTLLLDKTRLLYHIARAEKQHAFAGQAIAPGPPRFLIVAFDVLRQVMMHDEADIRFVNSHPERDRRRDHACVVAQKKLLMFCSLLRFESGVIWLCFNSIAAQLCR